ncbi:hypothetical protein BH10PSE18_BH10PSE18_51470 [soil metagenome]
MKPSAPPDASTADGLFAAQAGAVTPSAENRARLESYLSHLAQHLQPGLMTSRLLGVKAAQLDRRGVTTQHLVLLEKVFAAHNHRVAAVRALFDALPLGVGLVGGYFVGQLTEESGAGTEDVSGAGRSLLHDAVPHAVHGVAAGAIAAILRPFFDSSGHDWTWGRVPMEKLEPVVRESLLAPAAATRREHLAGTIGVSSALSFKNVVRTIVATVAAQRGIPEEQVETISVMLDAWLGAAASAAVAPPIERRIAERPPSPVLVTLLRTDGAVLVAQAARQTEGGSAQTLAAAVGQSMASMFRGGSDMAQHVARLLAPGDMARWFTGEHATQGHGVLQRNVPPIVTEWARQTPLNLAQILFLGGALTAEGLLTEAGRMALQAQSEPAKVAFANVLLTLGAAVPYALAEWARRLLATQSSDDAPVQLQPAPAAGTDRSSSVA